MAKNRGVKVVDAPEPVEPRGYRRIVIFAVVGFAVGLVWPWLAGVNIGPELPGGKLKVSASASAKKKTATGASKPSAPSTKALSKATKPVATPSNKQRVVVGEGRIAHCFAKRHKRKGSECGRLKLNRLVVEHLESLATCPAALGLDGAVRIGLDVRFRKKKNEIRIVKSTGKGLPSSTLRGIDTCLAESLRHVDIATLKHAFNRYRVNYRLRFYPPGVEIEAEPATDDAEAEQVREKRALSTVVWDTALVREEPKIGKVIARLVRGTKVNVLGRRKDWYRVRVSGKDGWVYRGALGR